MYTGEQGEKKLPIFVSFRCLPETTADIIPYLQEWTNEANLTVLHEGLCALSVPEDSAPAAVWQAFNRQLEAVILAHWGLEAFWALSQEQVDLLVKYLEANRLLVECMAVAYLPEREWVEAQLLLPPAA